VDRKIKNTLLLFALFMIISLGGGLFAYLYQDNSISEKQKLLLEIKQTALDTKELEHQLEVYRERASGIDSLLSLRN